jgi:hypothetical protein
MVNPRGILAPEIAPGVKLYGPVSYFPSIEKTYGRPMQEWIDLADEQLEAGLPHMKVVEVFKTEHGMGHGHANAVVGWVKQQRG